MVRFGNYDFMGPFILDGLGPYLLKLAGVYVIAAGDNAVLYVGESGDINDRVTNGHQWDTCWRSFTGGASPFVHALVEGNPTRRLAIEGELRAFYQPPCGRR